MINAKEAKQNAIAYEENRKNTLHAKLDEWVEAVVAPAVAKASAEGGYSVWVREFQEHYTIQENREYIARQLAVLGYRVAVLPSGTLDLHWN